MRNLVKCAVGALAALALSASALSAQQLTGAGATFPYPLYSKWFDTYHNLHPGVSINYQSIGSGGGIQQVKAGTVDFGASDAPLSDEEERSMPGPVLHIPTVAGAVVLAYNLPGAPAGVKVDGATIADMFLGKITRWNDGRLAAMNKGTALPNVAVAIAHRSDGSGTSYIYTHYLAAVSPEWKTKVGAGKSVNWPVGLGGKGNEGVAALIKQTPGGFGYVELAFAIQNHLPYAQVRNSSGKFISPSVESTTAAAAGGVDRMKSDIRSPIVDSPNPKAYPISGFTYLLVYRDMKDAVRGKVLADFLKWAMADGQKLAAPLYYAPLPKGVVAMNAGSLKKLTAGGKKLASN
jgi:phosphate transport system substrate-binding protein